MLNILLTGIGGQGTVLAAKLLATAAQNKGWHVRTAETIGMAQRGGRVVSHIRMGNEGEQVLSPLIPKGQAHLVIGFEPAEAARVLPYLAQDGTLIAASTGVRPSSAAKIANTYKPQEVLDALNSKVNNFIAVDDVSILGNVKSRKSLNCVLLVVGLLSSNCGITTQELKLAVETSVKPAYVQMNIQAIDAAYEYFKTVKL